LKSLGHCIICNRKWHGMNLSFFTRIISVNIVLTLEGIILLPCIACSSRTESFMPSQRWEAICRWFASRFSAGHPINYEEWTRGFGAGFGEPSSW
jgi:hypothetical protein